MFEKRTDLIRFLAVADTEKIAVTAKRPAITQPTLTRDIARLEHRFRGEAFRAPGARACCASPPTRPERRPPSRPPPRGSTKPSHRSSYRLATATRAEGLRHPADGATGLPCGGIDGDEPLPDFLRRERFLKMTAGVVAWSVHPLIAAKVTHGDLSRYP